MARITELTGILIGTVLRVGSPVATVVLLLFTAQRVSLQTLLNPGYLAVLPLPSDTRQATGNG